MSVTANIAQQIDVKPRTKDVLCCESVDFSSFLLSDIVLKGLKDAGFEKASPIQIKSIPLGTCGLDLIVQAKSGTGKTCVFTVVALNNLVIQSSSTQVLVLAPTREIAVQIWEVINAIGAHMEGLRCYTFIGGLPVIEDKEKLKKCHIAVGTPGRVKQLIEEGALTTESIRLFVLDEADKLMEGGFQEVINWIFSSLPENKQMLALSATYPESLAQHLTAYMRNPTFIRLNSDDPALMGIRQYYKKVAFHPLVQKAFQFKITELINILSSVAFNQCLVFSNYQARAESLSNSLNDKGWPSTHISGAQDQVDRLTAMATLKKYKCRVLVSTDLTSRGIDAEHINLVINLDVPKDHDTYLHRIGRAGRFGSFGAGITLASEGKEVAQLLSIQEKCKTTIGLLPDPIPNDLAHSSGYVDIDKLVITETVVPNIMIDNSKASPASVEIPEEKSVKQREIAIQDEHKESTEQVNEQNFTKETGELLTKTEDGSKRKILKSRRKGSGAKKAPWADWLATSEDTIRVETASRECVRDSVMYDDVDIFSNTKPKKSKDRKKKMATEKDSSKTGECNPGFDNETKNDSVDLERNKENVGPGGDAKVNRNVVYEMDETRGDISNIGKQSDSYSNKKPANKNDISPRKLTYGSKDVNDESGNSNKRMDNVSTRTQCPVKPAKKELKDMSYEQLLASYVHHRKKEDEGLSSDGSIPSEKDSSERRPTEQVDDEKAEDSSATNNDAALKTESDTQLSSPKVKNICVKPVHDQLQQGEFEKLKCELKEMLYAKRYPKPTVVRCYKSIHEEYLEELEKLKKLDDRQKQEELKKLYAEGEKKKGREETEVLDHKLLCSKVDKMLKHINSIHTGVPNASDDSKEQDNSRMPKETVTKDSAIDSKDVPGVSCKMSEIQKDNASENVENTVSNDVKSTDFKVVTNKGITDLKQEEIVKPKKPMFLGMKATRMEPSPLNGENNGEATETHRFSEKPDHRKESDKKKNTVKLDDNVVSSILKQKCDRTENSAPSDAFGVEYIRKLGALHDRMRNDNRESLEEGELSGSENDGKVEDCDTQKAANVRQTRESKKNSSNSKPQRRAHPYGPWEPVEQKKTTPDIEQIQKKEEPVLEDQIYHNNHCDDEFGRYEECDGYEEPFAESYHHDYFANDMHGQDRFETENDDYDWYDQNGYYRQDDSYFNMGRNFDSEMTETHKRFPLSHDMNRAGYPSYRSQSYGCPDQFEMWPRKPFRMGDHHLAFSQFEQAQSAMWASYMNHVYWMNQSQQYSRAEQYNYLSTVHSQWADYYKTLYKNSKKTKKKQPKP